MKSVEDLKFHKITPGDDGVLTYKSFYVPISPKGLQMVEFRFDHTEKGPSSIKNTWHCQLYIYCDGQQITGAESPKNMSGTLMLKWAREIQTSIGNIMGIKYGLL